MRNKFKIVLPVMFIAIAGTLFCCKQNSAPEAVLIREPESAVVPVEDVTTEAEMWIYVCGAVTRPGVYLLHENARVYEAIEAAGGAAENAADAYLNLVQILHDGEKLYVPSADDPGTDTQQNVPSSLAHLDTSSSLFLMMLFR